MADLSDDELSAAVHRIKQLLSAALTCDHPAMLDWARIAFALRERASDRALNAPAPSVGAEGLPEQLVERLRFLRIVTDETTLKQIKTLAAALASRPAVDADTERLNWLEQHPNKVHYFMGLEPRKWGHPDTGFYETLRAAIDAARHPAQREGE